MGGGGGGQGGCESRIEVFGKFKKKNGGGGVRVGPWGGPGWGVRMDVNEEVFVKIKKKIFFFWGGGGVGLWGSGWM